MENKKDIFVNDALVFQIKEKKKWATELVNANNKIIPLLEELIENDLKELADYKYALDASSIIAITDQKGIIKEANSNFCKISKYSKEELIGQDHRKISSGFHSKEFIRDLWSTIANGKVWKGELKNKAKDGTYYWVDTTIVPFLNKQGKPYQYLAIRADITERKKIEETLKERSAQLEIAHKNFLTFTFISSHDLQEPLCKIQILAGKIFEKENQNFSASSKNYFRLLQHSADRMRQLIKGLRDCSEISPTDRKFITTDLNTIVEEVKTELKHTILEKRAVIEFNDLCQVRIIAFQFRQVIYHILYNALKYSRLDTPPHIIIKSRVVEGSELNDNKLCSESKYCHISISDNGIGFESKYKERIFQMFQRLHHREVYEGTGMGLAIVKMLVENHNGIITAKSKLNKGATFDIYIPVSQQ